MGIDRLKRSPTSPQGPTFCCTEWVQQADLTTNRFRETVAFMRKYPVSGPILDMGEANWMGKQIGEVLCVQVENFTGDMDRDRIGGGRLYGVIMMFECLEHLYNPLFALESMRDVLEAGGCIYLSTPSRPHFLWSVQHFHEIDRKRMSWLFDRAGLKCTDEQRISWRHRNMLWHMKGVRPILRYFVDCTRIYRLEKA